MDELMASIYNLPEPKLSKGAWYTLATTISAGGSATTTKHRRMRAVKRYGDFWMFEDERGTRECWSLWEIARMI